MAEGTRMKALEAQVQQFNLTMSDTHHRVEQLELGANRSHEAIATMDRRVESFIEGLERRLEGSIMRVREDLAAQMQQFMLMFGRQNQVSVSPEFPPRERTEPILQGNREVGGHGAMELGGEPEDELDGLNHERRNGQSNIHQPGFPMPWVDIPTFDGVNPRWWLRKCERMFDWYNIPEEQRVSLISAYFIEVVDAWYQGCIRRRRGVLGTDFWKRCAKGLGKGAWWMS